MSLHNANLRMLRRLTWRRLSRRRSRTTRQKQMMPYIFVLSRIVCRKANDKSADARNDSERAGGRHCVVSSALFFCFLRATTCVVGCTTRRGKILT